jgi:hypothetical protein
MMQDTKMAAEAACCYANLYRLHTPTCHLCSSDVHSTFPLREHELWLGEEGKKCSSGERTNLQQGERQKKGLKIKSAHQHHQPRCAISHRIFVCLFSFCGTREKGSSVGISIEGISARAKKKQKLHSQKLPAHDSLVPKNEAQKMCVYT